MTTEHNRQTLILAAVAIALGACTPYAQRVANTCDNLGYDRGTPEFSDCMRDQMEADAADRAAWSGLAVAGFGLAQPRPTTVCTTYGNTIACR